MITSGSLDAAVPSGRGMIGLGTGEGTDGVLPPDLDPDGWVCRRGPNGQACWHHRAQGPAPWESDKPEATAHQTNAGFQDPAQLPAGPSSNQRRGGRDQTGGLLFFDGDPDWKRVANAWHSSVDWLLREGGGSSSRRPGVARAHVRSTSHDGTRIGCVGPGDMDAGSVAAGRSSDPGWALPSPDEVPEGWVCHRGADGRTFWHHGALGPAPWDSSQASSDQGTNVLLQKRRGAANDDAISTGTPSHSDDGQDPCVIAAEVAI